MSIFSGAAIAAGAGKVLSFFLGNLTWFAIIGLAGTILFSAFKYTNMVQELERNRILVQQLKQNVIEKEADLELQKERIAVLDGIIMERDGQIIKLNQELDGLTEDLPEDQDEVAPESIRETLRRLRGL